MKLQVVLMAVLVALVVSACGADPDVQAVGKVVTDSELAAQNAMQGQGSLADVQTYFATTLEGGNTDIHMARHIAYSAPVARPPGQPLRLSNFAINAITIDSAQGEARVMYQIDITLWNGAVPTTTTVTQNLLLVKTPQRGWRIQGEDAADTGDGSDSSFLGNLLSQ